MVIELTVNLDIDDHIKEQLDSYGKILRHEIYRIAGVFQKEKRAFPFPYRFMNQTIPEQCKKIVIKQAELLYKKRCIKPKAKLDFSAIWSKDACKFSIGDHSLKLSRKNGKTWILPLTVDKEQEKLILAGSIIDVTIKKQQEFLIAAIRILI